MRGIKYRAWNQESKVMLQWDEIKNPVIRDGELARSLSDVLTGEHPFIPLQYTNLTDKNSKEIYENDITYFGGAYCIVRFGEHGVPSIEDMEYVDLATGFYLEPQETIEPFNMTVPLNEQYAKDLVVIGNIFEHSHLLEQHHDN